MKRLLHAFVLLAALSANVHAGWLYIDIIICEDPPKAIEFAGLVIKVSVWDKANPAGMVQKIVNPSLSQPLVYCDTNLPGVVDVWNAWIWPGKQRAYGYDGKWYQIRWDDAKAFDNNLSNYTNMHLNFDWRIDPDQSAKPNESLPARRAQWWW